MFRFEHPDYIYVLAVIPVLVLFFIYTWIVRKRALRRFASERLIGKLMPEMSRYKHTFKFVLLMLALCFLAISLANPQLGGKKEKVNRKSVDIFIALDISQSMLAEDVSPSRLERAKRFAQGLIETLKGDRIGTIIFAGNAYLQVPLTTDYAAAKLFIRSANPGMAPSQGTAIVDAIDLAENSFEEENKNHKALIIISDGENHDEEALQRAKQANNNGLLIYSVGVGTPEGSFIPITVAGRADYKRDRTGNPVRSQLNEDMLKDLADAGDGNYFNLLSGSEEVMTALRNDIDRMEKREFEQRVFTQYESYFQYFLAVAILLIVIEFIISYKKSRVLKGKDLFST